MFKIINFQGTGHPPPRSNENEHAIQGIPHVRVLATGGSLEVGATIIVHMEDPVPLVDELKEAGAVEDAIEERLLDSHPLGDFLKHIVPPRQSKKKDREAPERVLVVLKANHD